MAKIVFVKSQVNFTSTCLAGILNIILHFKCRYDRTLCIMLLIHFQQLTCITDTHCVLRYKLNVLYIASGQT